MLQIFYELTPNVYAEMQTVRYKAWRVGQSCIAGQSFAGSIPFDDPAGTLDIKGWRKVRILETTASPTLIWSGRIHNKTVKRGDADRSSLRTGADRWWDCDAYDQNTLIGSRIIRGTEANRPAETAGERLAWLLSTSFTVLYDGGHITYPSDPMDPCDYTLQTAADVIADCAMPGGYNFFAMLDQVGGFDVGELFFMLPEDSDWASSVSISDDPADYDGSTVFAPSYGAEILISDDIIAKGVAVPYESTGSNAYVYVDDDDIGDEFAYVDKVAPMANVKSSTKATAIAERHLALSDTEDEQITCTVHVPANLANAIRPWHLINYKSTWMPGFAQYRPCRVVEWSIEQQPFTAGGEGYLVHLVLSPVEVPGPADNWYALLNGDGIGAGGNQVGFDGIMLNGIRYDDLATDQTAHVIGQLMYYLRTGGYGFNFGQWVTDASAYLGAYSFPFGGNAGNLIILGPFASGDDITAYTMNAGAPYDATLWQVAKINGVSQLPTGELVGANTFTIDTVLATGLLTGTTYSWTVP